MTYLGQEHPLRDTLDKEIRARPYIALDMPERITHLAVLSGEDGGDAERVHLSRLCEKFDVAKPLDEATHFISEMGPFRLRWERHTEFSTYTFFSEMNPVKNHFGTRSLILCPKTGSVTYRARS